MAMLSALGSPSVRTFAILVPCPSSQGASSSFLAVKGPATWKALDARLHMLHLRFQIDHAQKQTGNGNLGKLGYTVTYCDKCCTCRFSLASGVRI